MRAVVLVLLFGLALQGRTFDELGHKVVAQVALTYLDDQAKAAVESILGENYRQAFIDAVSLPLQKEQSPANAWMKNLHFVYFTEDQNTFDANVHCASNQCSVGAVLESKLVLEGRKFSDSQKKQALQYLIHYLADIHLPMNAGFKKDQSGMLVQLSTDDAKQITLHWAWNKGLYRQKNKPWHSLATNYRQQITREDYKQWTQQIEPIDWINESHQLAVDVIYPMAVNKTFDKEFIEQAMPIYDQQIKKASVRLAWYLNAIFSN